MRKLIFLLFVFAGFLLLPANVLAANAPYQGNSSFSSPSNSIPADGSTTGTITINLKDSGGNIVAYDSVSLSSSNDSTAIFNNSRTTDASGNATFTITSTTAGTTNVTLTDNTNAATFTNWFSVNFSAVTGGCAKVPATPALISVTSNSGNTATLTWVDSTNPVSNYLVSYGTSPGKYTYGNPNIGGQGTTSYTVGSLTAGKTYYFVVAASNVCGASSFSNEMSATIGPTPAPQPSPAASAGNATIVSTDAPTVTPEEIAETPSPEPVVQSGNSAIKNIAIALLASGVIILGGVLIGMKIKSKKDTPIPPIYPPQNPPVIPPILPPTIPPTEGSQLV
jgi:adhesin/invasin